MVYADNAHITEISIYYCDIRIGHGKLMHFNDLHLFTDTHAYAYE